MKLGDICEIYNKLRDISERYDPIRVPHKFRKVFESL